MTPYTIQEHILDLFAGVVDARLNAHTPDYGGPWTDGTTFTPKLDGVGGVYQPGPVGAVRVAALSPVMPTADCYAEAQVTALSNVVTSSLAGIALRCVDTDNYYGLEYEGDDGWLLFKRIAGVGTVLHDYNLFIASGETHSVSLICVGTTLTAVINGVPQTPVTDAAIGGAGKCGIILDPSGATTAATGLHVRQFLAGYIP